jgi:hypothetical protein
MFPDNMPWYQSRIIIGAIVSIVMKLLVATGVLGEVGLDDGAITDAVLLVIGGIADLWIMYQRVTQKAAPTITAT